MQTKKLFPLFPSGFSGRRRLWHWLVPMLLVMLFVSTLLWLPWQAQQMEATERQEQLIADTLWVEQTIRFQLGRNEDNLRLIGNEISTGYLSGNRLHDRLTVAVRTSRELDRVAWIDPSGKTLMAVGDDLDLKDLSAASHLTMERARDSRVPQYSQPAPPPGFSRPMMTDYHIPLFAGDRYLGTLVASYSLNAILDEIVPWWFAQENEIQLTDGDDNILARRASGGPGRNVYTHSRALELPYASVTLRTNSVKSAPKLLPNLLVGSVVALSLGLLLSLAALWRDINRRLAAEGALREQLVFRAAMENSLVTGMRARDLSGRVTYVNPAFCRMVDMPAETLVGGLPPMPYWAPEVMSEYQQRFNQMLAGTVPTHGFETIFQRANGERFPVLIFESPLVDESGRQTGWMGSILDISDHKRIEELNRRQQEKLQASSRLATMGEIASTLAHELNQPLAAISSYTTGALNLLQKEAAHPNTIDLDRLTPALEKASAQAQRAGQIIRSVHSFVKRREPIRERVTVQTLIDSVTPLVELQARRFFVRIQTDVANGLPAVLADQVMLEQVMLNLTRNAIEAMQDVPPERRILRIEAALDDEGDVSIAVIDQGHGIPPEIMERLFSPFFSTKSEGMGIGLNICRTTVEFHGGALTYANNPEGGTIFRFSLPAHLDHVVKAAEITEK